MKIVEINRYLVPFDFTESTEDAFNYAQMLVKEGGGEILLINYAEDKEEAKDSHLKLAKIVAKYADEFLPYVSFKVVVGNISTDLDKTAQKFEASAIIMGIHGRSGIRKVFGSNALKIVAESNIPFFLTQENLKKGDISTIVMPFNFERESLQITQFASSLAKKFNAKIYLVGYTSNDESFKRQMEVNATIVEKHLREKGIAHEIKTIGQTEAFQESMLEYARMVDADLIAAAYFDDSFVSIFNNFVDSIIENEDRIPVITVNGPEVMRHSPKLDYVPV